MVDFSDTYWGIKIGSGVRRSLIRHFIMSIGRTLSARGLGSELHPSRSGAETISNPDAIEALAWRMADEFIVQATGEIDGHDAYIGSSAEGALVDVSGEMLAEIEKEYLGADSLDVDVLCYQATDRFPKIDAGDDSPPDGAA